MNIKTILALASASMLLASCSQNQPEPAEEGKYELDLVVASPTGAPAVALYPFLDKPTSVVDINANPDNVVGYLTDGSGKDIVICPTNAGVAAIQNKGASYKLASVLTFGNFYLASTGKDDNDTLDADDYVVAFQQGKVPDKIFKYCFSDVEFSNLHYVDAASDASACLIKGINASDNNAEVDYVLVAEPSMTVAMGKNANAKEKYSLADKYKEKSGGLSIMQAAIFVSNFTPKEKIDAFLEATEENVSAFLQDPSVIDSYVESIGEEKAVAKLGVPSSAVLKAVTNNGNRMGLGYQKAKDHKQDISNFLSLFNITVNEEVYYQ